MIDLGKPMKISLTPPPTPPIDLADLLMAALLIIQVVEMNLRAGTVNSYAFHAALDVLQREKDSFPRHDH